jgi:hypothetical protein
MRLVRVLVGELRTAEDFVTIATGKGGVVRGRRGIIKREAAARVLDRSSCVVLCDIAGERKILRADFPVLVACTRPHLAGAWNPERWCVGRARRYVLDSGVGAVEFSTEALAGFLMEENAGLDAAPDGKSARRRQEGEDLEMVEA